MSLGSILKQARKSAGVSIDTLAERTSIRATLLRDFELDDFSKCGGDTYARGHVRNLAHALGVDPALFLEHYDAEQSHVLRPMHDLLVESKVTAPTGQRTRFSLKTLSLISASAVIVVVGGQVAYTNFQPAKGGATASLIAATTPTPSEIPTPSGSPSTDASPPSDAPSTSPAPVIGVGDVIVAVSAVRGPSWLSVSTATGAILYIGRLAQGQSRTFAGNGVVNVRFGNAGAVDVLVNGTAVPVPGANGEVVDRSYGSNSSN